MSLIKFDKVLASLASLWDKLNSQLCFWCFCRHLTISDISFYKQPIEKALLELVNVYPELKETDIAHQPLVCGGCYGVLTSFTQQSFLDQIADEVVKEKIEFNHFCCSIALPVASAIRDFSYLLMCADVCPEVYQYLPLEQIPSVKDVWKWMCGSELERRFNKKFALEHLDILIDFENEQLMRECNKLEIVFVDQFKKRKGRDQFNHTNVLNALLSVSRAKLRTLLTYPPERLTKECTLSSITCTHNPVYIAGRYNKYSRELSQSPWLIDGVRKGLDTSVSELISQPLVDYTNTSKHNFSSSGREDIDVQMLGNGRPFMLQLLNPRRLLTESVLEAIQRKINESTLVQVRDLQLVTREATEVLKDLEAEKKKTYKALCVSDISITQAELDNLKEVKDLVLNQLTPIRVLHRRPRATRLRTVHWMEGRLEPGSSKRFTLTLQTQAGTYVKEFVHGDLGRTVPNMSCLLSHRTVDILTLDVLSVDVNWPPSLSTEISLSAEVPPP